MIVRGKWVRVREEDRIDFILNMDYMRLTVAYKRGRAND